MSTTNNNKSARHPSLRTNGYPGRCLICWDNVPAQAGGLLRATEAQATESVALWQKLNPNQAPKRGTRMPTAGGWATVCASKACQARAIETSASGAPAATKSAHGKPATKGRITAQGRVEREPGRPDNAFWNAMPIARQVCRTWKHNGAWLREIRPDADAVLVAELIEKWELADERPAAAVAVVVTVPSERLEGLYPFQVEGAQYLVGRRKALLADDMGLGKTVQVLRAVDPASDAVLIVAKASLLANWKAETLRWAPEFKVTVLKGRKAFRAPAVGELLIASYDSLPTEKNSAPMAFAGVTVACDEAHHVKNFRAARHKNLRAICDRAARVWLLTATPLLNRPPDLYGVLGVADLAYPVFGGWNGLKRAFNAQDNGWGGTEWGSPQSWVVDRVRSVMLRRLKTEVLPDLPRKQFSDLVVNGIDRDLSAQLDELDEQYGDMLDDNVLPPFEQFSQVRAALAASRIPAMLEVAEEYEEAETALLVFSAHRAPIDALGEREGWATITGDTPVGRRQEIVDAFQAGKYKGLGLTIQAGGVGLTLTRASHELFVDLAFTPSLNGQAEDRAVRIGQKASSVLVTRMVSDHALDRRVQALLVEKAAVNFAALDAVRKAAPVAPKSPAPSDGPSAPGESADALQARLDAAIAAAAEAEAKAQKSWAQGRVDGVLGRETDKASAAGFRLLPLTDDRKEAIKRAVADLFAVCDGARTRDRVGFSKADAGMGAWLAMGQWERDEEFRLAEAILWRYAGSIKRGAYKPGQIRRADVWGDDSEVVS